MVGDASRVDAVYLHEFAQFARTKILLMEEAATIGFNIDHSS